MTEKLPRIIFMIKSMARSITYMGILFICVQGAVPNDLMNECGLGGLNVGRRSPGFVTGVSRLLT